MSKCFFTRRCLLEDLSHLPKWVKVEAVNIARTIEKNPEIGPPLDPPLDSIRSVAFREYRLLYTYDFARDTWWVILVGERHPGKLSDVYEKLAQLLETKGKEGKYRYSP
jgi:hypothetical protein